MKILEVIQSNFEVFVTSIIVSKKSEKRWIRVAHSKEQY